MNIEIGKTYVVAYPFVRTTWNDFAYLEEVSCWKPGVKSEFNGRDGHDDFATAMGEMHLTVISTHKPGKFPLRVFYTRQWKGPDGKMFGKTKCYIAVKQKFDRLCRGYAHDFEINAELYEGEYDGVPY